MKPIKIVVRPTGIRFLYDDRLKLDVLGPVTVSRVSNVEWDNFRQGWTVQFIDGSFIRSVSGEIKVFKTREEALAAEVDAVHTQL